MRKLIQKFVEYPVYANVVIAIVILLGIFSYTSMNKSFFPETESRMISISVFYPGASPVEMEEGVTSRIEESVRGLIGVKEINSTSVENRSVVNVETTGEYPIDEILLEVKNAVDGISSLPSAAERPIVSKPDTASPVPILEAIDKLNVSVVPAPPLAVRLVLAAVARLMAPVAVDASIVCAAVAFIPESDLIVTA